MKAALVIMAAGMGSRYGGGEEGGQQPPGGISFHLGFLLIVIL